MAGLGRWMNSDKRFFDRILERISFWNFEIKVQNSEIEVLIIAMFLKDKLKIILMLISFCVLENKSTVPETPVWIAVVVLSLVVVVIALVLVVRKPLRSKCSILSVFWWKDKCSSMWFYLWPVNEKMCIKIKQVMVATKLHAFTFKKSYWFS